MKTLIENKNFRSALSLTGLFALFVYMTAISWHKWPDILFDFGHQLYIPWRLSEGDVLYRDIATVSGPLSSYVHALLFRVFGVSMDVIFLFNILLILALSGVLYFFFEKTSGKTEGFMAVAAFLSLFAFAGYRLIGNFNFVGPYSYELTHGVFFALLTFVLLQRYLERPGVVLGAAMGLVSGLVFLTKAEVFLPLLLSQLAAGVFLAASSTSKPRELAVRGAAFLAGFALPVGLITVSLSRAMAVSAAWASLTAQYQLLITIGPGTLPYYRMLMGFDDPVGNLAKMLPGLFIYAVTAAALRLYAARPRSQVLGAACLIVLSAVAVRFFKPFVLFELFRPLPVAVLFITGYYGYGLIKHRNDPALTARRLPLFALSAFSFFLMSKMILFVHLWHIGFALAMPAILVFFVFILSEAPGILGREPARSAILKRSFLAILALLMMCHVYFSWQIYRVKDFKVHYGKEYLYYFDPRVTDRGPIFQETLNELGSKLKANDTLAVFPEGVMLNYFLRRVNPSRYIYYHYWITEKAGAYREADVVTAMERRHPGYVALVDINTSEHGFRYFGKDWGLETYQWLIKNYSLSRTIGAVPFTDKGFGIAILRDRKVQNG